MEQCSHSLRWNKSSWSRKHWPEGALPLMEGKSVLFKVLGNINAIPLCMLHKIMKKLPLSCDCCCPCAVAQYGFR